MFDFRFELEDWGWATSHFKWEGGSLDFRTSYLSNPITKLAQQARWLVDPTYRSNQEWSSAVEFADEPGQLLLTVEQDLKLEGGDLSSIHKFGHMFLTLRMEEWEDLWPPPGTPSDIVHTIVQMSVNDYVLMIFRELNDLWAEFGMVGYRRSWLESDFPVAEYASIGRHLKTQTEAPQLWGPLAQVWTPPPAIEDANE